MSEHGGVTRGASARGARVLPRPRNLGFTLVEEQLASGYVSGHDRRVQLANGVRDVQRGLGALRAHPGLWKWVLAPAVITLVLFVGLIAGVIHLIDPLVGWLIAHVPAWLASFAGSLVRSVVTSVVVVGLSIG